MKIEYKDMLLHEFRTALEACPVAYVPVGLLEWHGDHLPLGTDLIRAEWICQAAATSIGGIVLPGLYASCPGYSSYEGTLVFSVDTAVQLSLELAAQLEKVGFRAALFLSAHGGPAQDEYLSRLNAEYRGRMQLLALQVGEPIKVGDHAGPFETSDMLAAAPELVDLSRFAYPENPIRQYPVAEEQLWPAEKRPWVWRSDVRTTASSEKGNANLAGIIAYCREWLSARGLLSQEG